MSSTGTPRTAAQAVVGAILAGVQIIAGASALSDLTPTAVHGWFVLIVAAAQAAWVYYMANYSVPTADVAAVETPDGTRAGPAADHPTGAPVTIEPV